jgi:hypothetical protein
MFLWLTALGIACALSAASPDVAKAQWQDLDADRGVAQHTDWCLPQRISMEFEGVWRGLTLWGQLPSDGPVHGKVGSCTRCTARVLI